MLNSDLYYAIQITEVDFHGHFDVAIGVYVKGEHSKKLVRFQSMLDLSTSNILFFLQSYYNVIKTRPCQLRRQEQIKQLSDTAETMTNLFNGTFRICLYITDVMRLVADQKQKKIVRHSLSPLFRKKGSIFC